MVFDFNAALTRLAEMPAEYYDCAQIRALVRALLPDDTFRTRVDAVGNLYVTRAGVRPGHLMLCAHVDKNMHANRLRNMAALGELEDMACEVGAVLGDPLRFFERLGQEAGRFVELTRGDLGARQPLSDTAVYALPRGFTDGPVWTGKFDDAIGVALILELLATTRADETPTLSALFTVHEEHGLAGSEFAASEDRLGGLVPDAIIVVDVCPWVPLGTGVVLYAQCGAYRRRWEHEDPLTPAEQEIASRSAPLIARIEALAAQHEITLTTMLPGANDAYNLARYTTIPTVALELPIAGCHEAVEQIAALDVELMRRLLSCYARATR